MEEGAGSIGSQPPPRSTPRSPRGTPRSKPPLSPRSTVPPSPRTLVGAPATMAGTNTRHRQRTAGRQTPSPPPHPPPGQSAEMAFSFDNAPTSELLDFEETSGIRVHPECLDLYLVGKGRGCVDCRARIKALTTRGGGEALCRFLLDVLKRFSRDRGMIVKILRSVRGRLLSGHVACNEWLRDGCLDEMLIGLFKDYPSDLDMQAEVCETMAVLVTDNAPHQGRLREAGACSAVCEALRLGVADGDVRLGVTAAQACANLAWKNQVGQLALVEAGAAPVLGEAMARFIDSEDLLLEACGAIADISYRNNTSQSAFGNVGSCLAVCQAMSTFPSDRHLQLRATQAISNLGFMHPANQARLADAGAATLICTVMNQHQNDKDLHCEGCRAIDNLAWSCPANQERLGQAGACRIIAHTLASFEKDKVATLQGCRAAATLATNHVGNQEALAKAGMCRLVVGSLARYCGDRNIICECCDCIVALVYRLPAVQDMFLEAGAAMVVCEAMSRFTTERDVQLRGARVLANLATTTSGSSTALDSGSGGAMAYENAVGAAGACEILAQALQAFSDDRNLALYASRAVANVCCGHAVNQEKLGKAGGCQGLVKVLKKFSTDRDIQWYGVGAVVNLALDHARNAAALGSEACRLVTSSLRHFSSDKADRQVMLQALRAMVTLAKPSKANREALVEAKAWQLVCRLMAVYEDDHALVTYGARILDHLASDSAQMADTLVEAGAGGLLCSMLRRFPDREAVLRSCRAIVSLSWAKKTAQKGPWLDTGVCELLCQVMTTYSSDHDVLLLAIEGVANLAWGSRAIQDALREAGVLRQVVDGMAAFPGDVVFASECLRAISDLSHHNAVSQAELTQTSAARATCDAMRRFPSERMALLCGLRAIFNLTHHSSENQAQMCTEGAPMLIAETLRSSWSSDKTIVVEACRAVANLAWRNQEAQEALRKASVCTLLCEAVRAHQPCDTHLCIQSCRAFSSLAHRNVDCQTELGEAGACELLLARVYMAAGEQPRSPSPSGSGSGRSSSSSSEDGRQEVVEAMLHLSINHAANQQRLGRPAACKCLTDLLTGEAPVGSRECSLAALAIASIAHGTLQIKSMMLVVGAPGAVVRLLNCPDDKDLQVAAMTAISSLGSDHMTIQSILDDQGAIPAITQAMTAYPEDRLVQLHACEALLGVVALHAPARHHLIPSGAINAVCSAVASFPTCRALACHTSQLLALTPYSIADQELVGSMQVCESLVNTIHTFSGDRDVVSFALNALAVLSHNHPDNQERLKDACAPLLKALADFPQDTDVQRYGTAVVANLAVLHYGHRLGVEACRLALDALLRYHDDETIEAHRVIVHEALRALAGFAVMLAGHDDLLTAKVSTALIRVVEDVGAQVTEDDGKNDHYAAEVLAQGLYALARLGPNVSMAVASGEGQRPSPWDERTVTAAVKCFKGFQDDKEVASPALEVLASQVKGVGDADDACDGSALVTELAPHLCRALGVDALVRPTLDVMCSLLRYCTGTAQDELGEQGACAAVAGLLSQIQDDPSIPAEVVCRALEVLGLLAAEHEENRDRLDASGAGTSIIKLLQAPETLMKLVRTDIVRAAVELARDNEAFQQQLRQANVSTVVMDLMVSEREQPRVEVLGCWAIAVLSEDEGTRQAFRDARAAKAVVESLSALLADEAVQSAGLEAIKVLGGVDAEDDETCRAYEKVLLASLNNAVADRAPQIVLALKLLTQYSEVVAFKAASSYASSSPRLSPEALPSVINALAGHSSSSLPKVRRAGIAAMAAVLHALCSTGEGSAALNHLTSSNIVPSLLTKAVTTAPEDELLACHVATVLANVAVSGRSSVVVHDWLREEGAVVLAAQLFDRWGQRTDVPIVPLLCAFITACAGADPMSQDMLGVSCSTQLLDVAWHGDRTALHRCRAIAALAAGNKENQERLWEGCRPLVQEVLGDANAPDKLKTKALEASSHLCYHHAENQERLVDAGVVAVMVEVLMSHADLAQVQLQGIGLLRNLMWQPTTRLQDEITSSGLVRVLCTAIDRHGRSTPQLALYGLAAVASLATASPRTRDELMGEQACMKLIVPDEGETDDLLKATYACKVISAMAAHSSEAHTQLMGMGQSGPYLHAIMTKLLQSKGTSNGWRHATRREAAEAGALALQAVLALARADATATAELGKAGVCADVVGLLRAYPSERAVQRYGWDALVCLVKGVDANRALVIEAGALSVIAFLLQQPWTQSHEQVKTRLTKIGVWLDPAFDASAAVLPEPDSSDDEGDEMEEEHEGEDEGKGMGMTIGVTKHDLLQTFKLEEIMPGKGQEHTADHTKAGLEVLGG